MSDLDLSEYFALVTPDYALNTLPPQGSLLELVSVDGRGDAIARWDGREIPLPYDHYKLKPRVEPPDTAAAKLYLKRKKELEKLRENAPALLESAVKEFRAGIESLKKAGAKIELVPDEELTANERAGAKDTRVVWYQIPEFYKLKLCSVVSMDRIGEIYVTLALPMDGERRGPIAACLQIIGNWLAEHEVPIGG